MGPTVEHPGAHQRSLVVIAALAGLAAGSAMIVVLAMRHSPAGEANSLSRPGVQCAKPSVFEAASPSIPPVMMSSPEQIARTTREAMVRITSYDAEERPIATRNGFVYSADGMIVTSYQAIRGAKSIEVEAASGEGLHVISIMVVSPERDLAVLAVAESNLPALEIDATAAVQIGDHLSGGAVVTTRDAANGIDLIRTTAQMSAEQTGGPLLNRYGRVVAVTTGADAAVPIRYIPDLLATIKPDAGKPNAIE